MNFNTIIELLRSRDKKGLEVLFVLYGQKFFGYSVDKWKFSEDDSWEVVYLTLDTLVIKLPNYDFESQAHFENFVYKVFINFLRQKFRYNRRKEEKISYVSLSESHHDLTNDSNITTKQLEDSLPEDFFGDYYSSEESDNPRLVLLTKALEQLSVTDREILLLKAQNYTYDEIASMLKIENNQLKVSHHRAKARLIKILQQELNNNSHE